MEQFFTSSFGISPSVFNYIVLPVLIFLARVSDVSIATIRIMFVMIGKRRLAPLLGFFEALIWLLAIGQIFQNINSPLSYIAYAAGFAAGTYVGMFFEEKLAVGNVLVRIITKEYAGGLIEHLKEKKYRFSSLDAEGNEGKVSVLFTVVKREQLHSLIPSIVNFNPNAFYTIESVKRVSHEEISSSRYKNILSRFITLNRR
ncbi:MAG: DUF2179 domain-containing protein [Bacteroidota bacterium]|jgi:uncharacterized protein YebE (UPF0316 family)|nr:DUF2179 domain-containing protein [Bacteroidota bacterium]